MSRSPMVPPCYLDPRDAKAGVVVSDLNGYYDSQNIVAVGGDGETPLVFSVVLHHCPSHEGGEGLRLYSTRSVDRGRTWSPLQPIESSKTRSSHDGYQLVHRRPDGGERIYVFYGYNEGVLSVADEADGDGVELPRGDMQLKEGYFCKYSDDHALTWSAQRFVIPVRRTQIDRDNPWAGEVMGMFMCDKPTVIDGAVYFAFQKTTDGAGETPNSEVFFMRSTNFLSVQNPADAVWETLPLGEKGLQAPNGALKLGEEPHLVQVNRASAARLLSVWRTEVGKIAAAYSNDGGAQWEPPFWLNYEGDPQAPEGGRPLRNPRGAITPFCFRQCGPDGRSEFILLFYNNGRTERLGYVGRLVYWVTVGRASEDGQYIRWSQPEIALWWDGIRLDDREEWNADWAIVDGPGYPDWLELADGALSFVESNKLAVRYHEVSPFLVAHLRSQPEATGVTSFGQIFSEEIGAEMTRSAAPVLPDLRSSGGFSLMCVLQATEAPAKGTVLVHAISTVTAALDETATDDTIDKGYAITVCEDGEVELWVSNGFGASFRHRTTCASRAGLWDGARHTVTFIADGGPKVIRVVVDEWLDDGGAHAPQGWASTPREMGEIGGAGLDLTRSPKDVVKRFVIYNRALLTTEAIAASRTLNAAE